MKSAYDVLIQARTLLIYTSLIYAIIYLLLYIHRDSSLFLLHNPQRAIKLQAISLNLYAPENNNITGNLASTSTTLKFHNAETNVHAERDAQTD